MALGRYPEVALADARERRDAARKRLANGIDPMAQRMTEKTAVKVASEHTLEKIAERWLEHRQGNKSGRHEATTKNRLKANVYRSPIGISTVQLRPAVESNGDGTANRPNRQNRPAGQTSGH
jgi:Arm DNA-binding domain